MKSIQEEFKEYSEIDIKSNYSLGHAYSQFSTSEDGAGRNFGFVQKDNGLLTPYQKMRHEMKLLFCQTLMKFVNQEYAKKLSGLGRYAVIYYTSWLNAEAEKRGMPVVFEKKKKLLLHRAKLHEKQVSYIKFLVTKYPTYKVAKMYNVSQSAIYLIKCGSTWKHVASVMPINLK